MSKNIALKLRPNTLNEFICDGNLKFIFQNVIDNKDFHSFIFYGPPGTGKTTISYILAKSLNVNFDYFNAAIEKKEELVKKIKNNKILIIDEVHRLNKDKQDILLPYVENGQITIYATTTENPYFKINPALRSRCSIIELKKPSNDEIIKLLKNANDKEANHLNISEEIYKFLALQANGDVRVALNNFELVATIMNANKKQTNLSLEDIKKIIPAIQFSSDKGGDAHYDYLSAFHKSLRGSDPDAALYYGFLIVKSGDFDGLFRRLICASYEDVGLANPHLQADVIAAINAFERIGMPEGYLPIGYAILAVCLSPKSNSVFYAASRAQADIEKGYIGEVPNYLKDAHYKSASKLNRGLTYKYPHDYKNHWVDQKYLPKTLQNKKYYDDTLTFEGYEAKIKEYWNKIKGN